MIRYAILAFLLAYTNQCHLICRAQPLGYERYSLSNSHLSDFFLEQTPQHVYSHYAKQLILAGTDLNPVNDKRLIDIETNILGEKPNQKLRLSGVWIENSGQHQRDSWLMTNVTFLDIAEIHAHFEKELIPLDIESYKLNGKKRYAVIWQRNIYQSSWYCKYETSEETIRSEEANGFRVVDFDHYVAGKPGKNAAKDWEYFHRFDAVMVENSGGDFVDSEWTTLFPAFTDIWVSPHLAWEFLHPPASQIVDIEFVNWQWVDGNQYGPGLCRAIVVHNAGNSDQIIAGAPYFDPDLSANQSWFGKIIDLEGGNESDENWKSSPLPNWDTIHTWQDD